MEMKSNVVILYASQYSMKDENGRPMEGVSAAYIIGDNQIGRASCRERV